MDERDGAGEAATIDDRTGMEVLGLEECLALLGSTPIGRVVFVDGEGQPLALPVNYLWYEDSVVFRTLEGQKVRAAVANQKVAFEVDRWDPETGTGISVLVKARAEVVDQWAEREQLEQLDLLPWAHEVWRTTWIRLTPVDISGRRVN